MPVFDDIMQALEAAVENISIAAGYNTDIKKVVNYGADMTQIGDHPAVAVIASGENMIDVEDIAAIRFNREIEIRSAIKGANSKDIKTKIIKLSDDTKKLIFSDPSLGSACLDIIFEGEDTIILHDNGCYGINHQRWRVLYVDSTIKSGSAAGTDVYGSSDVYHDAIEKIYAELDTLKTAMSGLDPTFGYLHKYHGVADLHLNAVTLEIDGADGDYLTMSPSEAAVKHQIGVTIHVHTAYAGGQMDVLKNMRLLNSIETHLFNNVWLDDNHVITGIEGVRPAVSFEDSRTLGGKMTVLIQRIGGYTQ